MTDIREKIMRHNALDIMTRMDALHDLGELVRNHGNENTERAIEYLALKDTPYNDTEREIWCLIYAMHDLKFNENEQGRKFMDFFFMSLVPFMWNYDDKAEYRMMEKTTYGGDKGMNQPHWLDVTYTTYQGWYEKHKEHYQSRVKKLIE